MNSDKKNKIYKKSNKENRERYYLKKKIKAAQNDYDYDYDDIQIEHIIYQVILSSNTKVYNPIGDYFRFK